MLTYTIIRGEVLPENCERCGEPLSESKRNDDSIVRVCLNFCGGVYPRKMWVVKEGRADAPPLAIYFRKEIDRKGKEINAVDVCPRCGYALMHYYDWVNEGYDSVTNITTYRKYRVSTCYPEGWTGGCENWETRKPLEETKNVIGRRTPYVLFPYG